MHTFLDIFRFFYRLQSSNCFFTLRFVAAAGRRSVKAAKAEPDGRGPGTGRLPEVALNDPGKLPGFSP